MDTDLKNRLTKVIKREKQRGAYLYNNVQPKSIEELVSVCNEYHKRELSKLSVRGTIKMLAHKIANKFSNK